MDLIAIEKNYEVKRSDYFIKRFLSKIKNMLKIENLIVMYVKSIFNYKRIKNKFDYWSL